MTIADNYEPIKQETNGVTTQFSFDFYALNDAYIKVLLEVDGEQSLIDPTDYEVTFTENGGLVNFYDAPAGNAYIIITRDTPREQETPFATSSGFPAKTVEGRLDKLTAMVQEIQDDVNRSAKVPVGTNISPNLPVPDDGKALVWDGTELSNSDETLQSIADKATGAYSYAQEAKGYRDEAIASADLAEKWAIKTDGPVANDEYSAKYHAQASASSATASAASAEQAAQSAAISNPPPLLWHFWADHLLNDIRYLRADTFSWQDGGVYKAAYDHLLKDVGYVRYMIPDDDLNIKFYRSPSEDTEMYAWTNQFSTLYTESEYPQNGDDFYYHNQVMGTVLSTGIELGPDAVSPTTETVGSYTITYYPCADGHKVVLANQESTVSNIYNESGVAWYYILDLVNHKFKLPRTKYDFVGLRDTVGEYVPETLPNFNLASKETNTVQGGSAPAGSLVYGANNGGGIAAGGSNFGLTAPMGLNVGTLLSKGTTFGADNSAYQDDAPVQQRATQMYLYFYVGNYTQSATEQTAGLNAELFNGKADVDLSNVSAGIDFVVEWQNPTAENNYTWYRLYKSGWVEQGGITNVGNDESSYTMTFTKTMADINYFASYQRYNSGTGTIADGYTGDVTICSYSTTSFSISRGFNGPIRWEVKGMSAQGA